MPRPLPGDIVSRRKGLVMHRGIALGDGRVLHNTPFRGEHICSEEEFRAGKRLYVSNAHVDQRRRALHHASRHDDLHTSQRRSYNLLTNNCEHTVSRAATGRSHSPQLKSWVIGGGMAASTFALTRHPAAAAAAYALGRKLSERLGRL